MMLTSWGYTLTGVDTLPAIITETEFNTMTGGRYTGDSRVAPGIASASSALRNHCGWHLAGALACKIKWLAKNRGITRAGADLIIQLPARFVSAVSSVKIDDTAMLDFFVDTNGLLTVFNVGAVCRKSIIEVEYTAGHDSSEIKELLVEMVTLNVAKSYGVTSEAAGGVSVTYNSSWTNGSYDRILDNNAGLLAPYRLEGVF